MKRKTSRLLSCLLALVLILTILPTIAHAATFTPAPETVYATAFLAKCDGQAWFINEVERQLNLEEKTINRADGPTYFSSIISLGLTGKKLTGTLPPALGELTALRHLFLSGNQFIGPIPSELLTLTNLEDLDLSQNQLSGEIPAGLSNLTNLKVLLLWGNGFTGPIPASLSSLSELLNLDLSQNYLTGSLPASLGSFVKLEFLGASQNTLTGAIPSELGSLAALKGLSLWGNNLTGGIPSELGQLSALEAFDLSGNPNLGGSIPSELANCTALKRLTVSNCKLTGSLPAGLAALPLLETLDFSRNLLRGIIPVAYGTGFPALQKLYLQDNKLTGYAPNGFSAKETAGAYIDVSQNYMTGAELLKLTRNADNFTDGAVNHQNKLALAASVYIAKDTSGNLYTLLRNASTEDNKQNDKPLLLPTEYKVTVVSGDPALVEITINATGIFVKPLGDISLKSPVTIEIQIINNDGSAWSKTRVDITTEKPADNTGGGGGGSGGGVVVIDPGETPLANTFTHEAYIFGYPDNTFRPEKHATRAEFVAIMARITDTTLVTTGPSFPDVPDSHWAVDYIRTAKANGWINGYPSGKFGPDDPITRAEAATVLARIFEPVDSGNKSFSDIAGHWARSSILAVASGGNLGGYPDGTFRPDNQITRAELVRMVNVMLNRAPDDESVTAFKQYMTFTDVPVSHWAYKEILEASVGHEGEYADDLESWMDVLTD